ncbi:flagellar protein FlgN [Nocardioides sp. NPDC047086]|uniref:flagellar protein FlgN n=1 Tax=Nocardioides sp. NPDC047086 TaxID=3154810 RepID=UPI0033CD5F5B
MADDFYIDLNQLNEVKDALKEITSEFEDAEDNADDLEDAIGDPYGRSELREAAEDFEDRWNHKRDELKESLADVLEHVKGVIENVEKWDSDTAIQLSAPEVKAAKAPAGR